MLTDEQWGLVFDVCQEEVEGPEDALSKVIHHLAKEREARQRDRRRLLQCGKMIKKLLGWETTACYVLDLLRAQYEREDKLEDDRDQLRRNLATFAAAVPSASLDGVEGGSGRGGGVGVAHKLSMTFRS